MTQINLVWYKTPIGKAFIIFLIIIGVIGLAFITLTGYYIWQIKYGSAEELAQEFNKNFTLDPSRHSLRQSNIITQNPADFMHEYSPTLGPDEAPITILAFIDFECPFCRESYPIFKKISEKYAPAIKIVFKHLPVSSLHKNADAAHIASTCASEQDKFWEYYNLLFTQKLLDSSSLDKYANQLQLNSRQFTNCVNSKKYQSAIDQDLLDAVTLEIRGTPTYIVNQRKLEGVIPENVWDEIIIDELQNSK